MTNDPQRNTAGAGRGSADDLQFERVETAPPPGPGLGEAVPVDYGTPATAGGIAACAACGEPIADVYFEANGKVVCPRCREAVAASREGGSGFVRLLKATAFGIGAGIGGALIWYGVRRMTGYEVGLIAILVGLMVGGAVKAGSNGRGGLGYQLVAVLLTYLAIASNYIPDILGELRGTEIGDNPVALAIVTAVAAVAAPFLGGLSNIIGLLIIGFALYQAWSMNRANPLTFNGPYRLAPAAGGDPAGFAPAPLPPPPAGHA